ncbi:molybdopterin biosynthesis moeb protein [Conidiobolus coronatus NRRL 28638]|uniref:Needs CLA4 to survive protein 3 n=1 Tax=Conidiobolus coronatus (strain ATCC 28846 / CBS 209.66 / NRRL 28638) TaxID=796925 RepID=A0A137NZM2_CONC2|nr:molybdopterin biosynthesis moeb protein [Conidiobolus coronatus NRRL 28638]|eukprot:KXN68064.1 molybdopterin biosynthesis moeb protein [Conidiobolus coronatus NRRL 28638]
MSEINNLKQEILELKQKLQEYKKIYGKLPEASQLLERGQPNLNSQILTNDEIKRYGRQLILPDLRYSGQLKLKNAKVLVVGAGGLGSPALLYLSTAGVGRLGVVDHDTLDLSNLPRQVIHPTRNVDKSKAESAKQTILSLNPNIIVDTYTELFDSSSALKIVEKYDIVLDCTDNVATRYLINDCCVLLNKPLISGSALKLHGQLTIYNYKGGPCYRCLYPKPPPPETVTNCSDGGVLGPVTGIIGCFQALEAIKMIIDNFEYNPSLVIFSADRSQYFTQVKLRSKKLNCAVCGTKPTITELIDYVQFCSSGPMDKSLNLKVLGKEDRISCLEYNKIQQSKEDHILIDVREDVQFEICQLPNSINIPLNKLEKELDTIHSKYDTKTPFYFLCRLGNDSQLAVAIYKRYLNEKGEDRVIKDIQGGLLSWTNEVDKDFPIY